MHKKEVSFNTARKSCARHVQYSSRQHNAISDHVTRLCKEVMH